MMEGGMMNSIKFGDNMIYCVVEIANGVIVSIYEENGRDGGLVWSPKWEQNGDLNERLAHVAYDWKDERKYNKIKNAAYKQSLPSYRTSLKIIEDRIRKRKKAEIKRLEEKLNKLRQEIRGIL